MEASAMAIMKISIMASIMKDKHNGVSWQSASAAVANGS